MLRADYKGDNLKRVGITQRVTYVGAYNESRDCLDQRWPILLLDLGFIPVPLPNVEPKNVSLLFFISTCKAEAQLALLRQQDSDSDSSSSSDSSDSDSSDSDSSDSGSDSDSNSSDSGSDSDSDSSDSK